MCPYALTHKDISAHTHTPDILHYSKHMPGIVLDILHIHTHTHTHIYIYITAFLHLEMYLSLFRVLYTILKHHRLNSL